VGTPLLSVALNDRAADGTGWRRGELSEFLQDALTTPANGRLVRPHLINAVSPAAALNPAELSTNQPDFNLGDSARLRPISRDLAAFDDRCGIACHAEGRGFESLQPLREKPRSGGVFSFFDAASGPIQPVRRHFAGLITKFTTRIRPPGRRPTTLGPGRAPSPQGAGYQRSEPESTE
jgi:hypothetical protein